MKYTIGIDYGTLSCRALVMNAETGETLGGSECGYTVYDKALPTGEKLPDRAALADPAEYLQALEKVVHEAIANAHIDPKDVAGIAVDTTSMSLVSCDQNGTPLCMQEKWKREPLAYIRMWKSYTATKAAEDIGRMAKEKRTSFLAACGGNPSSEGAYPKLLETLRKNPELYNEIDVALDLHEWLAWVLTGKMQRSMNTMGMKNYCADGKTLPSGDFWRSIDERFENVNDKLRGDVLSWGERAGELTEEMADKLGLPAGIAVASCALDGHAPMMALGLKESGDAMMTIGTSGVLCVISDHHEAIDGICGQSFSGLVPGFYGYDFAQSGVGDMFGWFVDNCVPGKYERMAAEKGISVHQLLSEMGFAKPVGESGLVAVDWWNGSRSIVVDQTLTGVITGMKLSTKPEDIYRALVEAAAFGMRAMRDALEDKGVKVNRICVCGGIAAKNPLLLQCYADILGSELRLSTLPNSAAAGAAIAAAAAAGAYPTLPDAMDALSSREFKRVTPDMQRHAQYEALYEKYKKLRKFFGENK
ncbi:MAG: ribulokinase [Clostridia bacterium]|nr:ribulokinase [Clostridia bacterium]